LGVPLWIAPLVAAAVDLSLLGLLLGTRHLALQARPRRRGRRIAEARTSTQDLFELATSPGCMANEAK
jgi:hypothetical protein